MASVCLIPTAQVWKRNCWPHWAREGGKGRRGGRERQRFANSANRPTSDLVVRISFRFLAGGWLHRTNVYPVQEGWKYFSATTTNHKGKSPQSCLWVCACACVCVWITFHCSDSELSSRSYQICGKMLHNCFLKSKVRVKLCVDGSIYVCLITGSRSIEVYSTWINHFTVKTMIQGVQVEVNRDV